MSTSTPTTIYWFRQDLRLQDLPGLQAAIASGRPVIPCYIFDPDSAGDWAPGAASRWWLHHSLASLAASIEALGGELLLLQGDSRALLRELAAANNAHNIYCSRAYEPAAAELEQQLNQSLSADGRSLKRYPGSLLFEPEQIANQSGLPFKVFTPFWKACRRQPQPSMPGATPAAGIFAEPANIASGPCQARTLQQLKLLPEQPDWASHWSELWQPGESGAGDRLQQFLRGGVARYSEGRDHPALEVTTRLSAHIHHGEISPRQIWHAAMAMMAEQPSLEQELNKFLSELGWREFSCHLLHHFPQLPEQAFKPLFDNFPWLGQAAALEAWQRGQTGYPIVDAGMRELWQTGFMHNRVRMIVASFLTKHLLISWQTGEAWFWDTLVDADLASNACSWQWVAGSGADASPYFRIFNPTLQGQKFDKAGDYVRQWVPEIAALPDKHLHEPAAAPADILASAGITLGQDYPEPIVDHRQARQAALAAYQAIKAA
ncbi:MAG: deoxyribodipyrimidine photo-lyase [Halieaceae bacterium]